MPYVELLDRTSTTLTCRAADLPSNASGVNWYLGTSTSSMPFVVSCDGDTTWTFDGLQPNTLYYVKFLAYDIYQASIGSAVTDSFYTLPEQPVISRPYNWVWTSNVSQGARMPAGKDADGIWRVKPLSAAEWNGFIDRIFAFAAYKKVSFPGVSDNYYVTQNSAMLASEVNVARALILLLSPSISLPAAISSNGEITAAFINGLKNSLNSIE